MQQASARSAPFSSGPGRSFNSPVPVHPVDTSRKVEFVPAQSMQGEKKHKHSPSQNGCSPKVCEAAIQTEFQRTAGLFPSYAKFCVHCLVSIQTFKGWSSSTTNPANKLNNMTPFSIGMFSVMLAILDHGPYPPLTCSMARAIRLLATDPSSKSQFFGSADLSERTQSHRKCEETNESQVTLRTTNHHRLQAFEQFTISQTRSSKGSSTSRCKEKIKSSFLRTFGTSRNDLRHGTSSKRSHDHPFRNGASFDGECPHETRKRKRIERNLFFFSYPSSSFELVRLAKLSSRCDTVDVKLSNRHPPLPWDRNPSPYP